MLARWLPELEPEVEIEIDIPEPVHIFLADDMAAFESRAFEPARHDFSDVVAQYHPNSISNGYQLHDLSFTLLPAVLF